MAQTTIEQFATEMKMPPGVLLEQLAAAGVAGKKQGDKLSEQDKTRLLDYLRKQHGGLDQKKKITLTRKQTTEIKAADSTGRARTIQVEVRKKRVFVKRDGADAEAAAPVAQPAATAKPEAKAKTEGTLHKPVAKPGAKKDKPSRKPSATAFQEEAARRRALKLCGDVTSGAAAAGWKQPKGGKHRH